MAVHKVFLCLTFSSKHHPWQAQNKSFWPIDPKTLEECLEMVLFLVLEQSVMGKLLIFHRLAVFNHEILRLNSLMFQTLWNYIKYKKTNVNILRINRS